MKIKKSWLTGGMILAGAIVVGLLVTLWLGRSQSVPELVSKQVGISGPVEIRFGTPMRIAAVDSRLIILPVENYRLEWRGNSLMIWPQSLWKTGDVIKVTLDQGAETSSGRVIRQPFTAQVQVREVSIIYRSPASQDSQLWLKPVEGGDAIIMAGSAAGIMDMAGSSDGNEIVFSKVNDKGGADLWGMGRNGETARKLVDCGEKVCDEVSWRQGFQQFAYSQLNLGGKGEPRVYTYDWVTNTTNPLFSDPSIVSSSSAFSPDGTHLAFYNISTRGITILTLATGSMQGLQTESVQKVVWTPDSASFYFVRGIDSGGFPVEKVFRFDLSSHQAQIAFGHEDDDLSYSTPAVSPDGSLIAVPVRPLEGGFSNQIRLFDRDGNLVKEFSGDAGYTNSNLAWSLDGTQLLFQRVSVESSTFKPDILLSNVQTEDTTVIAQDAAGAAWLP